MQAGCGGARPSSQHSGGTQADLWTFETSLVNRVSSRIDRDTEKFCLKEEKKDTKRVQGVFW